MQKIKYEYEDPTGGGDDAVLILPETFTPPSAIRVTDQGFESHEMALVDPGGEEVEE